MIDVRVVVVVEEVKIRMFRDRSTTYNVGLLPFCCNHSMFHLNNLLNGEPLGWKMAFPSIS